MGFLFFAPGFGFLRSTLTVKFLPAFQLISLASMYRNTFSSSSSMWYVFVNTASSKYSFSSKWKSILNPHSSSPSSSSPSNLVVVTSTRCASAPSSRSVITCAISS